MKGHNLVVFYYLNASEIWPDNKDGLCRGEWGGGGGVRGSDLS